MRPKVAIANDHAGYRLKTEVMLLLLTMGYEVIDLGCDTEDSVDYPDFAHLCASQVSAGNAAWGIVICGTANGVCITANKHSGVRAALCWNEEVATLVKQHNNANIIGLPARFLTSEQASLIVQAYMKAEYEGGRHENRVNKIEKGL